MKKIVIIGGGFAGVAAGLYLKKYLNGQDIAITLVDKESYHLFTPALYEFAASEISQESLTIPFDKIFENDIQFIRSEVKRIDTKNRKLILLDRKSIKYDYLIISAGSESVHMNIPGLAKYSIGFKTISDAIKIKDRIIDLCCKEGICNRKVKVIIGGGGFSGTELAAELLLFKDRIAVERGFNKDCLDLTIIQRSDRLIRELGSHVSKVAKKRLNFPNVHLNFGGHIKEVTETHVFTDDGKSYEYQIFIWTGGIEPNHLAKDSNLPINDRGGIIVNDFLQVQGFENVFACGDIADFIDTKAHTPVPKVAQVAYEQGAIAAENVIRLLEKRKLKPYKYRHFGYLVPIRGRFAIVELRFGLHIEGFLGWCLQQLVLLNYLLRILSPKKALKRWGDFELDLNNRTAKHA